MRKLLQFFFREIFDIDHVIVRFSDGADDFVQLQMDGVGVAVLGVLNEKDDQEGNDGRSGIDHQLPGIRIVIIGTGNRPHQNNRHRQNECPLCTRNVRGFRGEIVKAVGER